MVPSNPSMNPPRPPRSIGRTGNTEDMRRRARGDDGSGRPADEGRTGSVGKEASIHRGVRVSVGCLFLNHQTWGLCCAIHIL